MLFFFLKGGNLSSFKTKAIIILPCCRLLWSANMFFPIALLFLFHLMYIYIKCTRFSFRSGPAARVAVGSAVGVCGGQAGPRLPPRVRAVRAWGEPAGQCRAVGGRAAGGPRGGVPEEGPLLGRHNSATTERYCWQGEKPLQIGWLLLNMLVAAVIK